MSSGNSDPPNPEILSQPATVISGRTSPYASAPAKGPVEAEGEEDVEYVKASRSGDFIEGGPRQGGGGPADGSVAVLGEAHRARGARGACR